MQPANLSFPLHRTQLESIAESGRWAPSADNGLDYSVEYAPDALHLWAAPDFPDGEQSQRHRRVLGLMAFGAAVENMQLRASELGWRTTIDWAWGDEQLATGTVNGLPVQRRRMARIAFDQVAGLAPDPLAQAIMTRQTNRHFYSRKPLAPAQQMALGAAAAAVGGAQLIWLQGKERKKALELIWLAESERFLRRSLHEELFSAIQWHSSAAHGLPWQSLEIEALMRPAFRALRHWPLMRRLNHLGMHRLLGFRAGYWPCWQAPALGVVVVSSSEPASGARLAGQAFERIWLSATLQRLVLQPMAASTVLPFQNEADQGASHATRQTLQQGWQQLVGDRAFMVFRIGHADGTPAASFKTQRRSLTEFIPI